MHEYMLWQSGFAQALYSAPVIDRAQERRKLYGTRTILFVKDVVETLNHQEYTTITP
jgi:hypothetical protein